MELNSSYYLNNINISSVSNHSGNNINNKSTEVDYASMKFSSLFFERLLNTASPEVSLMTDKERSAGEVFATQLLNQRFAEVIAKNSEIKDNLKKLLEKQNNVIK